MRWGWGWGYALGLLLAVLATGTSVRADDAAKFVEDYPRFADELAFANENSRIETDGTDAPPAAARLTNPEIVVAQYEAGACAPQADCRTPGVPRYIDSTFGGWVVTGSGVALMPLLEDTYFALNPAVSSTFPTGTRANNEFSYQSGFRIGAAYQFCDDRRTLQINYTSLDAEQSRTLGGDFLWATVGRADFASSFENYSGTAASSLDFSFRRIDASFSQPWRVYDDDIYFRYGLEYADFDLSETDRFISAATTGTVTQTTSTLGCGPEFGIGIDHTLWHIDRWMPGNISLDMLTTASLLVGQSNGHAKNVLTGNTLLDVFDDNASRLIPAIHARLALNYNLAHGTSQTTLTFGYEFNSYIRALSRMNFPDDVADGLATSSYSNFDIHGFFASATFAF